ncbi:MAG: antitoxin MazE family protein [Gemmatimonadaceae bacterium]
MPKPTAASRNVQRYRDRMRRAGLRLVQLWVPDARAPGFADECRRQSRRAGKARRAEQDVMKWIEGTQDTDAWTV